MEIELSSLCLPWSLYWVPLLQCHWYKECLCRDNLHFCAPEAVTTAKWRDVLEREQFSSRIGFGHISGWSTLCLEMVSLLLYTVRPMIMTYMLLLQCLHPYFTFLNCCVNVHDWWSYTVQWELYQWIIMQRVSNAKLRLQSTEAYFLLLMCFFVLFYYYVRRSVQLIIHVANIEASKFVCFLSFFLKLFLKISQMSLHNVIVTSFIYFSVCFRE